MGKGYNNYMSKKFFHPSNLDNVKRVWMQEQAKEAETTKQDELRKQYEREQELYNNRALISNDEKLKLGINFMYEAPPGVKREEERGLNEPEVRFEWQRNAPRESFAVGKDDVRDQPFGIAVRNVRCIKCHKWGHINTDKECPLYNAVPVVPEEKRKQAGGDPNAKEAAGTSNPMELVEKMREDGLKLKDSAAGWRMNNPSAKNQAFVESEDEESAEIEFLKSLTKKQKKKLLRKLEKLEGEKEKATKKAAEEDSKSRRDDRSKDDKFREPDSRKRDRDRRSPDRRHAERPRWTERKYDTPRLNDNSHGTGAAPWESVRGDRARNDFSQRQDRPTGHRSEHAVVKREPSDSPPRRRPETTSSRNRESERKDPRIASRRDSPDRRKHSPDARDSRRGRRESSSSDRERKPVKRSRSRSPAIVKNESRRRSPSSSSDDDDRRKKPAKREESPNAKYRRLAASQPASLGSSSTRR